MVPSEEADIKLRILRAAKRRFAEQGYDGASVRQICDDAGANVALVSYYFGGKENLFASVIGHYYPARQVMGVDAGLDPVAGLKLLIAEVTRFREREPELIRIIQQEIMMDSPRIEAIAAYVMPTWKLLRKWLAEGKEQGLFRFRSLDTAFMSVVGTLLFYRTRKYWQVMQDEVQTTEELIADLTEFIMHGLQAAD